MEIKILTKRRKQLNAVFLIGIICAIFPWLIIFPIMHFYDQEASLAIGLIIFSFIAIGITLIIGFIRLFSNTTLTIKNHNDYVLIINSHLPIEEIKKANQIAYTRNYIKNKTLHISSEITNIEAFKILQNKPNQHMEVIVEFVNTPLIEQSPTDWFKSLMSIGEASS